MKYKKLYDKTIDQEYQKINGEKWVNKNADKLYEWYAIVVALMLPDATTEELYEESKKKYPKLSYTVFIKVLRAVNLDIPKKRRYILKTVKKTAKDFELFLDGDKEATVKVWNYIDNLIERDSTDNRMYFKGKYLLTYLFIFNEKLQTPYGQIILENYLEAYCSKMLRMIFKDVSSKIGFKKTTKEVLESTRKALNSTNSESGEYDSSDQEKVIENLQFQVNNYKNTLELVQSMFDDLKDSVEESAIEAKNTAVSEFFASLNAREYGNILDNLITVEKRLAKLRAERISLSPEIMPLAIIFKQLLHFIKEYGITPIEEQEKLFDATYEEISLFNYQGEPYVDDHEVKMLQVVAPGWKYNDIIISLPTVREV